LPIIANNYFVKLTESAFEGFKRSAQMGLAKIRPCAIPSPKIRGRRRIPRAALALALAQGKMGDRF
jgi:hypothetical protein